MLMPARQALITTALFAALLLALAAFPSATLAHGNIDQSLAGDPGCNTTNFAASVTAASGQRQSFVPTGAQLASVALCVSAASTTPLVVAIYDAGGTLIGGGSTANNPSIPDAAGPPVRYVHVDFVQPYSVTPGATYTIENVSGVPITWYGATASSPYTYCLGAPNTSAVVDYAFQSFLADSPAASPACEPTPTNTPPPAPTNTPLPPTNTSVPGEPAAPTNTPAPGEPAVAVATPATDNAVPPPTSNTAGDTAAPTGSAIPSSTQAGSTLPRTGYGPDANPSAHRAAVLLLLVLGAALASAGLRQSMSGRKIGRR